ncbi:DUF7344 domain-containing protein [Halorientalis pallida]|uniref:DUF7344 domain-containing protein n=1 Tax=Halorientalis pallida TaxID=2479928 RepID=A0A498L211_9EURY|nr:hypothetical protein [Halorientalis pallida]RXK51331.1 hypothetical protein EAF64_01425 [Halorientalis pallida]
MSSKAPDKTAPDDAEPRTVSRLLAALADSRGRRVVSLLRERRDGIPESELPTLVVSAESGVPLRAVSDERHEAVVVSLKHHYLPALESAGLVQRQGDTVKPSVPSLTGAAVLDTALDLDASPADTETALDLLASERRRTVIEHLRAETETTVDDLITAATDDSADEQDVHVSLVHRHLPKLADADAISYEERGDERRVVYEGLPVDDAAVGELLPDGGTGTRPGQADEVATETEVQSIDGRDDIVAHGQALFDRAEEELFVMVTTDGLLAPLCLERLRDAVDRGVEVYVGSQTRTVRDTVREEVPGATIWEPQRNWLDLPPTRDRLGRLVLVDREAVMLGTIDEAGRERALVGNGEDDVLVVLLRELLGERLDHLDGQSDDVLSHLPL